MMIGEFSGRGALLLELWPMWGIPGEDRVCLMGNFLEQTLGTPPSPPRNCPKLFTGLLQPTFKEGTGSFVSGGPYGPEEEPPAILETCDP